ncbi:protein kinase [Actinoplanes sp. NPDC023801]|uniref:serine/threonine-protein kinase n=1 Tax=Actinoplanes sp. NPDC023801 TaxID=3154595 RepID=UPI0033DF0EF4
MSGGSARVVGGRYRLDGWLGRGGMGAVWQAHDTLLGRDVAVKEIYLPGDGDGPVDADEHAVRRAMREARAAARLRHPGIVTVHDVVVQDGRPWIVMELISGPSLAAAIREHGLLTEHRCAAIGLQVLDALRAAHREGVLHRDVKPANILLDADRVVLTDFGIAAVDDATALTTAGQMIGSPAYLAPERVNGRPATAASDLWSLGVTLYTAVTGRPPFHGADTQGTLAAVLHGRPATPAHAGQLWPVLKGLLAKDPAHRLTADRARPLLEAVVRTHGEVPGRKPTGRTPRGERVRPDGPEPAPTLPAPPVTLAAPTAVRPPDGPAAGALPSSARRQRAPGRGPWIALVVVSALLVAGAVTREVWLRTGPAGSAAPEPATSATTGPGASAPTGVPAAFAGRWSGRASQPGGSVTSWQVTITFAAASSVGEFESPTLNCTWSLTVVDPAPTGRELRLRQEKTSWDPRGSCVTTADLTLRLGPDDRLEMRWQAAGDESNQATASLTRS